MEYTITEADINEVKKNLDELQKEHQRVSTYLREIETMIQRNVGILSFVEEKQKKATTLESE